MEICVSVQRQIVVTVPTLENESVPILKSKIGKCVRGHYILLRETDSEVFDVDISYS